MVQGLWFMVLGSGFRIQGQGSRVLGFGFWGHLVLLHHGTQLGIDDADLQAALLGEPARV
jgi:hypothetical protein